MDLLLQRRMMIQASTLRDDYITDGLVLWMDGIDKGPDDSAWVDKINGIHFVNSNGSTGKATFGNNYVELDGIAQYFYYNSSSYSIPNSSAGTIEAVFETYDDVNGQMIFMPRSGATRIACYFNPTSEKIWITAGNNTKRSVYESPIIANTKMSISLNNARGFINNAALTSTTTDYIGGAKNNYTYIGKRRYDSDTDPKNFFKGKLYSIRIYNRQLTAAEVAHNYQVDRQRFKF